MAIHDEEDESRQHPNIENHYSVPTLLPDLVIKILLMLPVECLLRCKSVCKLWYSLVSDPHFVKSHLSFSISNNHYAHHRLMLYGPRRSYLKSCPLYDAMYDKPINWLELEHPFQVLDVIIEIPKPINSSEPDHPSKNSQIFGSCNGLLCVEANGDALFLWNPSTRRSIRIPNSGLELGLIGYGHSGLEYGFGYDESSEDYKVVALWKGGAKLKRYSLKSGRWKKIGGFPGSLRLSGHCSKFSNGALHWTAASIYDPAYKRTIVSLDLTTETYVEVKQPMYDGGYSGLTIGALGECLSLLYEYDRNRVDVWVMKVYGVQDSWTKLVSVQNLTTLNRDLLSKRPTLCFANDEKILFEWDLKLVLYDFKNGTLSEINNCDRCVQACTIVESLVSPDGPMRCSK